jgi:4-amino-4-deoxy-L-arabinose transferase-like glycosyltransferase
VTNSRRFGWILAAVALGGFAVRVAYVLTERRDFVPGGDAFFYHAGANLLADGEGFISPFFYPARHVQAAEHPPLYTIYLAVPSLFGMHSVLTHVLWSSALGTATVVLVGLLGRAVAGDTVGIIAAVLAAIYPNIWAPDGMLQAETLGMFTVTLAVFLAYRYLRAPSWQRLIWVGAACALGALARSELVMLVPLLVVPLALLTRTEPWSQRWKWLGVAVAATAVLIAPWSIYNTTRFAHPILLSAQIDPLLASANCDSTYYGALRGYFDIQCNAAVDAAAGLTDQDDESQRGIADRRAALRYVRGHLGRLPYVEGVRTLRILGLYHPQRAIIIDTFVEGRDEWVARGGLYTFWIVGLLAVPGAIVLRRRRTLPVYPLLAPIGVVVVTVLVTYASTRFRSTAEPALVVLAAVTIDAAVRAVSVRAVSGRREEVVAVAGGDRHDRALRIDPGRVGEQ